MITKQREHFGACENLTLTGKANELALYVNQLFNYGIVTNIPDNYDPTKDTSVMLQSDKGRMARGFASMAMVQLQNLPRVCAIYKGKANGFKSVADQFASAYIAEFQVIDLIYRRGELEPFADRSNDAQDFGWSQTHDAI